jgi:hypothetical protein
MSHLINTENFHLACLFGNLLCGVLYAILPSRVLILCMLAFTITLVLYLTAYFYGSNIAIRLTDAHTDTLVQARKSSIESVCP